ncbi:MAG: H-NS histone family protein [Tardiphaga sp.]
MASDYNFAAMSVDALWQLHEELRVVLAAKMTAERDELDSRLKDLTQFSANSRRATGALQPKAGPVYRNPDQPQQIWSGRGLRPRWLVFQLAAGRSLDEFRVDPDRAPALSSTARTTDEPSQ